MYIDTSIIDEFLANGFIEQHKNHWLFWSIQKGQYLFETPSADNIDTISKIYKRIMTILSDFAPLNSEIFNALFPNYLSIRDDTNVILSIGCPPPYDAMVRPCRGKEYVIFDLGRLAVYMGSLTSIATIITQLVTHELAHRCIHSRYAPIASDSFYAQMDYLCFDEGFAHLLSFTDEVMQFDFLQPEYERYFRTNQGRLNSALHESMQKKQAELLEQADCGSYWEKFGAISGMLYLAHNTNDLFNIYNDGYTDFCVKILSSQ